MQCESHIVTKIARYGIQTAIYRLKYFDAVINRQFGAIQFHCNVSSIHRMLKVLQHILKNDNFFQRTEIIFLPKQLFHVFVWNYCCQSFIHILHTLKSINAKWCSFIDGVIVCIYCRTNATSTYCSDNFSFSFLFVLCFLSTLVSKTVTRSRYNESFARSSKYVARETAIIHHNLQMIKPLQCSIQFIIMVEDCLKYIFNKVHL